MPACSSGNKFNIYYPPKIKCCIFKQTISDESNCHNFFSLFYSATINAQTNDWKIGVQLWTFHISNYETALQRVDSCGLTYIQLYPGQPINSSIKHVMGPSLTTAEREAVKK